MDDNRYYIVNMNDPNILAIGQLSVGALGSQRVSLDGTQAIIKLPKGDETQYPELEGYEQYNHSRIREIVFEPEWYNEEVG